MRPVQLLPLFICALMVGWFAPSLPTASAGNQDNAAAAAAAEAEQTASLNTARSKDAWLAGQTVIEREPDGHFYASALVDGYQYRFLVDTGASIVALTRADADAMGLQWDEASLRPIGRGASGTVNGVPITIDSMEVGGFEVRNVRAAIIPDGLDVSLLGQTFLSQLDNVEFSGDEMRLGS